MSVNSYCVVEYLESFTLFDKNGDLRVNTKELATVLRSLGQNPTNAEIKELIGEVDKDGKRSIHFISNRLHLGTTNIIQFQHSKYITFKYSKHITFSKSKHIKHFGTANI